MGIFLFAVGIIIALGAFAYMALSMISSKRNFDTSFRHFVYGMIVMVIGGFIAAIGSIMAGADFISNLVKSVSH